LRGVADAAALERGLARFGPQGVVLLDLKRESDALYQGYRTRVLKFALLGAAAIALLLGGGAAILAAGPGSALAARRRCHRHRRDPDCRRRPPQHLPCGRAAVGYRRGSNYTLFFEHSNMATASPERT